MKSVSKRDQIILPAAIGIKQSLIVMSLAFLAAQLFQSAHAAEIAVRKPSQNKTQIKASELNPTEKSSHSIKADWSMGLAGDRFESEVEQQSLSKFFVQANFEYPVLPLLTFNIAPRFSYSSGFSQNQERQNANTSTWSVRNASADINSKGVFSLQAGALDQSVDHSPILLSETTFPAVRATLQNTYVGTTAEAAIATSSSLSTQTRSFEKTPTFQSAGIFGKYDGDILNINARVSYFQFLDLPLTVSTDSTLNGNTGRNTSGTDSEFVYEYKGYQADGQIKLRFNKSFAIGASGALVQNQEAPSEKNQGAMGKTFADVNFNKNIMLTPSYEYFQIQSDAAVAYYNDPAMNTNRAGYRAGLATTYQDKVKFSVSGGERSVLVASPNQEREKTWNITLETMHAPLF